MIGVYVTYCFMSIDQDISDTIGYKVGKYTKYQRTKRAWSLNELAKRTGLTAPFLLRLERGSYKSVQFDIFEKIANGFEMTVEDFLEKCQIISGSHTLPPLEYYIKEKFQFPDEAIDDIKLFIALLKTKYKKQILELKEKHNIYWGK